MTIAGAIYPEHFAEESLTQRMLARAPYFPHHLWRDGPFEMGRALTSNSPPLSPIADFLIILDGNIYNLEEIRQEIKQHRQISPQASVEELLAHLFAIHQENCFHFLNGNFVIAIYDKKKQELVLARDRLGEKSLLWSLKSNAFLFANSLKAILDSQQLLRTPDLEALSFYVSFGFIPQEKTPIQGVFKLQPGHYLKVSKEKNLLIRPYWAFSSRLCRKKEGLTDVDLQLAISEAWQKRLSSSSSFCYTHNDREWEAISQDAKERVFDVPPSKHLSSQSVFFELPEMVWQLDEPVADLALPALWQTCKELQASNTTELFFSTGSLPQLQQEIHPPQIFSFSPLAGTARFLKEKLLIPLFHYIHPKSAYAMLRSIHTHPWHIAFLNQTALFNRREFSDLHSDLLKPVNNEIFLHRFPALERLGPTLSSLLYLYHKIKLPPSILLPQERFCAHFGIVRKAPYLDCNVIDILAATPDSADSFSYAQIFKTDFSRVSSLPSWATEIAISQLTQKLSKSVLVEAGLFSPCWLKDQVKNFNRHPHLFFQELWGLLILEIWFRQYIEGIA